MATYTAFADMSAGDKQQLVLSLASLVLIDAGADITVRHIIHRESVVCR